VPVPPPPAKDGCYRLRFEQLTLPTNDDEPVPCRSAHTTQTIHVAQLDTVVDGHLVAVDSKVVQEQLARTCPRKLAQYVGGNRSTRPLSRLKVVWFSPTVEQSDRGANWFRCELVALASSEKLAALPRTARVRGVLNRPSGLDEFGLCGTAAPGTRGFQRVICGGPHSWAAISTIRIDDDDQSYPGVGVVRNAGDETCRDQVQDLLGFQEQFSYGWEWPTAEQWGNGQRSAVRLLLGSRLTVRGSGDDAAGFGAHVLGKTHVGVEQSTHLLRVRSVCQVCDGDPVDGTLVHVDPVPGPDRALLEDLQHGTDPAAGVEPHVEAVDPDPRGQVLARRAWHPHLEQDLADSPAFADHRAGHIEPPGGQVLPERAG